MYICEYCKKEHDGSFGSGRFCSKKCKQTWCNLQHNYFKEKMIECPECHEKFWTVAELSKHKSIYHKKSRVYKGIQQICKICGYIAISGRELMKHKQEFKHYNYGSTKGIHLSEEKKKHFRIKLFETWKKHGYTPSAILDPIKEAERRKKISETMRKNKRCGGYRPGSGKAKYGWYKGYWCDSSWELAYTIFNLDHNIPFQRNKKWFPYHDEKGNCVKYYPDYILPDGTYVEIKGRECYQDWKLKLKEFPTNEKLTVLNYWGMKPYIKYVTQKYGKNFTDMYEISKNK